MNLTILLNQPYTPDLVQLTKYLEQIHAQGWYTNFGPLHQELTVRLEDYLDTRNLLLVSNGTVALQVAYKTMNIRHAVTTPFSFVATASSLLWQGIETTFSDIDPNSYNLSPESVRETLRDNPDINGIIATHVYGNPCDVDAFAQIADEAKVKVIYDAAHAFGIKVNSRSVLDYGDASTLSFHATKLFHTIEGGAIVFKNKENFERAKKLINFGLDEQANITEAGINGKLNEYQCAVGLTILDNLADITAHRCDLFLAYSKALNGIVEMPLWHESANYNGSYMPINLGSEARLLKVQQALNNNHIQSRRYFSPSLDQVFQGLTKTTMVNSQKVSAGMLCLPLHFYMSLKNVLKVVEIIKKALV